MDLLKQQFENLKTDAKLRAAEGRIKELKSKLVIGLVTPDNYLGVKESYIHVIECPKCKHEIHAKKSNYCSGCGIKLKLSTTVQNFLN